MQKTRLGGSDLFGSKYGLGCMSLGTDEKHAFSILEAALEEGINYFDTADLYDQGQNEKLLGRFFKNKREDVIIATKVGNKWNDSEEGWTWDASKSYIKEQVKTSLKRLDTDYIDLYQLHGGTIEDHIDETIDAFEELRKEGIIRYYGISSIRPNVIREYVERSSIVAAMIQYSILDRRPDELILPLLDDYGISAVTRGPVAKGLLSPNYAKKLAEKGYLDYSMEELKSVLTSLEEKFKDSRTLTEAAIQFNLSQQGVTHIIAGASTVEQLRENVKAVNSAPLTSDEIAFIQEVTKISKYAHHR